ncbi:Apolipoprotein D, partial [Stegodyphus mimosarum]
MSVMLVLAVVLSVLAGCHANSYRMGGCPRVTVMKSLDFDRFSGDWYVVKRFNPMATCTKISIEKGPEDVYTVNETSRPFGLNLGFNNQYMKARKVKFLRNDTNSIFRVDRNYAHFALSTFGVVNTDYDNYAVVWGCDPVLFGSIQNIDILARDPKPSADVLTSAKNVIKEMGVDSSPLENVHQSGCQPASQS